MKKWSALAACALLAAPVCSLACGMNSTAVTFPVGEGVAAGDAPPGQLPPPPAAVVDIVRGIGANHATCNDTGLLTVMVEWPRGTTKLRDIGFEFSTLSPDPPYAIFPAGPVQGRIDGRRSEFLFLWREGGPAQQKPIDMQVEVRAVTRDNLRGPPTLLVIRSPPGG